MRRSAAKSARLALSPQPSPLSLMRIISFNANGIRSAGEQGFLRVAEEAEGRRGLPAGDQGAGRPARRCRRSGPTATTVSTATPRTKKGYSGVAIYSKREPDEVRTTLGWAPFDEARGGYLEARYGKLSVVSLYVPSGSSGEERQQFKFKVDGLDRADLRRSGWPAAATTCCAATGTSCARATTSRTGRRNQKNSGCLPEERAWLDGLFTKAAAGSTASARCKPDAVDYTWWSQPRRRARQQRRLAHRLPDCHFARAARSGSRPARSRRRRGFPIMRRMRSDYIDELPAPTRARPALASAVSLPDVHPDGQAARAYADRDHAAAAFRPGLPLALSASTLEAWCAVSGLSLKTIGVLKLAAFAYVFKFLWAALVDRYTIRGVGRRRSWMFCDAGRDHRRAGRDRRFVAVDIASWPSLFWRCCLPRFRPRRTSQSMPIALINCCRRIAAWARLSALPDTRAAMVVSGGLALILADYAGFRFAYLAMAALMGIGLIGTAIAPRADHAPGWQEPAGHLSAGLCASCCAVSKVWHWLGLILVYKLGNAVCAEPVEHVPRCAAPGTR